jgi:hypothetical protein
MVFCRNCGKELPSTESVICPACGVSQGDTTNNTIVALQTKNSGTAVIIALIAGFFGFNGIGHIYVGKTLFGIVIMIIGWLIGFLTATGVIALINNPSVWLLSLIGLLYLGYWIWQAYDANKKVKYYNEYIMKHRKEPW